jgi:hypothetical protein
MDYNKQMEDYEEREDISDIEEDESDEGLNLRRIAKSYLPAILIFLLSTIIGSFLPQQINITFDVITFLIFFTVGFLSIFIEFPENINKGIEQNVVLDSIFGGIIELGGKVNNYMKEGIDKGDKKGGSEFYKGMGIIFLYIAGIALLDALLAPLVSILIPISPDLFAEFSFLYGAGIAAISRWVFILRKKIKTFQNTSDRMSLKQNLKKSYNLSRLIWSVSSGLMFWIIGLVMAGYFSPEQAYIFPYVVLPIVLPGLFISFIWILFKVLF